MRASFLVVCCLFGASRSYDGIVPTSDGLSVFSVPAGSSYGLGSGCAFPGCEAGAPCSAGNQSSCASKLCGSDGRCQAPTCTDGTTNGWEVAQDCGGICPYCDYPGNTPGSCLSPNDCASGICAFPNGYAPALTALFNMGQNGDNGGGRCLLPTGADLEQNGGEADIDCGAARCVGFKPANLCPLLCQDGWKCNALSDCKNSVCQGQDQETVSSFANGAQQLSVKFCVPPALSSLNPAIGARIRGGMRLAGVHKRILNFPALAAAVAWMVDVPAATILPEVLMNEYLTVQVGNASYLPQRLSYGWQPITAYNVTRRRALHEADGGSAAAAGGEAGDGARAWATVPGAAPGTLGAASAVFRKASAAASFAPIAPPDAPWWQGTRGPASSAAGAPRQAQPQLGSGGARAAALAPGVWNQRVRPNAPYNLTLTDTVNATRVRWVVYVGDYETLLLQSRMAQLYTVRLLPGGWAAERAVQQQLDWIAQDAEYCEWYGRTYALPSFNMSGVDCAPFLNCTVSAPMAGRVDGPWLQTLPDGSSVASRYDYNETLKTTVLTVCTSPPTAARAYPALDSINFQTLRQRRAAERTPPAPPAVLTGPLPAPLPSAFAAAAGAAPPPTVFDLHAHSAPDWLASDFVKARLREWVRARCAPLWRAADASAEALSAAEAADAHAAARCPRRSLGAGAAQRGLRAESLSPVSPLQLFTQTSAAAGLLPEAPRYNLVDLLQPGVPRSQVADLMAASGVNYDAAAGPIFLPPGASSDSDKFGRAPPDPPSNFFVPAALRVLVDPRGTPGSPLVRDQPFAIQPVVDLVDRHGRHVSQWKGSVTITAFIDTTIFPSYLFAAGTPSPSPSNRPVLGTHYVEPSTLQQQLYPENVLKQLVAQPLQLGGSLQVPLALGTGLARFTDLYATRIVKGLVINFTCVFTTQQLNMRITLRGATRPFDVAPPPPAPLVLITRYVLPPAATWFFIAAAIAVLSYGVFRMRHVIAAHMRGRSDMKLRPPPPDAEGARAAGSSDGAVLFTPKPTLIDWLPFRYIFGLLPLGLRKSLAVRGSKRITWDPALHPELDVVAQKLAEAIPPPPHLAVGAGLKPVPPTAVAAFDDVGALLRLHMAPPGETARERRKRERAGAASPPQAPAAARTAADDDALAASILGELSSEASRRAAAAQQAAAAAAAAEAAAAERARLEEENKRFSLRMGGRVLLQGTLPPFMRKALPPMAPEAAAAAAAADGAGLAPPLPPPAAKASARRLSTNTVLLALHARFTVGGPGLDPVSKLPVISRSLDVSDEPPADAGTQTAQQLLAFEMQARARAKGLHNHSKTKTATRGANAPINPAQGGGGGGGAAQKEVVFPESELPGATSRP